MKKVFYLLCLFALNAEAQISELWNQAHNELKKIKSTELRDTFKNKLDEAESKYRISADSIKLSYKKGAATFINMGFKDEQGNDLYWGKYDFHIADDGNTVSKFSYNEINICEKDTFLYNAGNNSNYKLVSRVPSLSEVTRLFNNCDANLIDEREVHYTGRLRWGFKERYYVSNPKGISLKSRINHNTITFPLKYYWTQTTDESDNGRAYMFAFSSENGLGKGTDVKDDKLSVRSVVSCDRNRIYEQTLGNILLSIKKALHGQAREDSLKQVKFEMQRDSAIKNNAFLQFLSQTAQTLESDNELFDYSIFMEGDTIRIRVCSNKNTSQCYTKFWEKINQFSSTIYSSNYNQNFGYIKKESNQNNEWDFYNIYWEFILNTNTKTNQGNRRSISDVNNYYHYYEDINGKEYSWSQKRNESRYIMKDNGGNRKFMSFLWDGMQYAIKKNIERFVEGAFGKENIMDLKINPIIPIPYSMNYINPANAVAVGIKVESDLFYIPAIQNEWEKGTPLYEVKFKVTVPPSKKVIKKNASRYQVKIIEEEMRPYTIFDGKKLGTPFTGTPNVSRKSENMKQRGNESLRKFGKSLFDSTRIRIRKN